MQNKNAAPLGRPPMAAKYSGNAAIWSNDDASDKKFMYRRDGSLGSAKTLMRLNQSKALFGPRAMARYESWGKDPTEGAADSCARFNE